MWLSARHTINNMLTLSAAAVLAIRAIAGGQFPNFNSVDIARSAHDRKMELRDVVNFANLLAHDEHPTERG